MTQMPPAWNPATSPGWADRFVAPPLYSPGAPAPPPSWYQWQRRIDPIAIDSPETLEHEFPSGPLKDQKKECTSVSISSGGVDTSVHLEVKDDPSTPENDANDVTLEQVLHQQFRQLSSDGFLLIEEVPGILSSVGVAATEGEIQTAMSLTEIAVDAKIVTFDQLLAVLNLLTQQTSNPNKDAAEDEEATNSAGSVERGSASDRCSLALLIATVSVVMLLTASLVVGLSIFWLLMNGIHQAETALQSDVQWIYDLMNYMITVDYVQKTQAMNLNFAVIIAELTEKMGYAFATTLNEQDLSFSSKILTHFVGQWWNSEAMEGLSESAQSQAAWMADLLPAVGANMTYTMASMMAQGLPVGYELLVGRWTDASNTSVTLLFPPRYASECAAAAAPCDFAVGIPFAAALDGSAGSIRTTDYRSQSTIVGYAPLGTEGLAVVLKVDTAVVFADFVTNIGAIIDFFNADNPFETLVMAAQRVPDGTLRYVSTTQNCTGSCLIVANQTLYSGGFAKALLTGFTGFNIETDYTGQSGPGYYNTLPDLSLAFSVKDYTVNLKDTILTQLGLVTDEVNAQLPGTEEIEEAEVTPTPGGGYTLRSLTHYRFANECANHTCTFSGYITTPAANCSSGTMTSLDYRRTVPVSAGYTCMASLSCVEAFSVDYGQLLTEGKDLGLTAIDSLNAADTSTVRIQVGVPQGNLTTAQVTSGADVSYLTALQYGSQCLNGVCPGPSTAMQLALHGGDVLSHGEDYRGTSVYGASMWLSSLSIGITAEQDTSEIMAPIIQIMWQLIATSFGLVVACTLLLLWYTISVVLSMAQAEKEGQEAIRSERGRFGALVAAMYPAYVVDRVLAGDRQIVQLIPQAAVFFSDIYNFTVASNRLSSEQLLGLLAYTYGVMDVAAEYYHVLKVKTIGDAYLAIAGLPGMGNVNSCLDMMHFAAAVARVFSCRFDHPTKGDVLRLLQHQPKRRAGRLNGKSETATATTHTNSVPHSGPTGSTMPSDAQSLTSSTAGAPTVESLSRQAHCTMSYGIVVGPVTAGVLQGKSPMFDIWGKTVNLASRMQSTSVPGRIQVSEAFCRAVMATPGQPFTFEDAHDTYCKGFGLAKSFFVRGTTEPLPKDLQALLGLELNHGTFFFDAVTMPGARLPAHLATAKQAPAGFPLIPSEKSNVRNNPLVVGKEDPISLLEMDHEDHWTV